MESNVNSFASQLYHPKRNMNNSYFQVSLDGCAVGVLEILETITLIVLHVLLRESASVTDMTVAVVKIKFFPKQFHKCSTLIFKKT